MQRWDSNFLSRSPLLNPFSCFRKNFIDFESWPSISDLNRLCDLRNSAIITRSGESVRFVPQIIDRLKQEQKYESRIYLSGQIQTRIKNWHDFFNALVWQVFPHSKSELNQLHFLAQLSESKNNIKNRCAIRDAVTLFDESGVIVTCSNNLLIQLLENFEWKELFWKHRKCVLSSMRFFIYGHGLYEKALNPYTGMTGKGIIFNVNRDFFSKTLSDQLFSVDTMLESYLSQNLLSSSNLTPIPLLGYPGWIRDNESETYYDNKAYFRDRRIIN
ncbi:DUF3025 domain-containing protein [Nitrosomonas sp.]|uniref:DUF3025 domain-containing protein n=1 Tax=Nitrosomonas sp. TaxID=42353 RepID=UPI001D6E004F|nr:DUF3025 domain-containing protein [Nitrosomonas sp.]MBX3617461.1 DUF3025 domain-containing protein [Nitrosomonas sp.]